MDYSINSCQALKSHSRISWSASAASFMLHSNLLIHQLCGYQLTSNVWSYSYRVYSVAIIISYLSLLLLLIASIQHCCYWWNSLQHPNLLLIDFTNIYCINIYLYKWKITFHHCCKQQLITFGNETSKSSYKTSI